MSHEDDAWHGVCDWDARRCGVHSVFFGWKRTHWATQNYFRDVLARLDVTANRYDVLLYLHHHDDLPPTQRQLRAAFGVARSTMSETLRALVRLGLIARERASDDARTYSITLTARGRAVFEHARRMIKGLVRRTLAKIFRIGDSLMAMHDDIAEHMLARHVLGDTAVTELVWLWHPDI